MFNIKKLLTIDWGTDDQTEIIEQIKGTKSGTKYNLHLVMQLPDFVADKAKFKGKVVIRHGEGEMETILEVSHSEEGFKTKAIQYNAEYFEIASKDMIRDVKKEEYDYYKNPSNNNTNEEDDDEQNKANQLWYQMQDICNNQSQAQKIVSDTNSQLESLLHKTQPVEEIDVGLFSVNQLLGRVVDKFEVICTVEYLPEGDTDSQGNKAFPYLLSYQYKVVSWFENLVGR